MRKRKEEESKEQKDRKKQKLELLKNKEQKDRKKQKLELLKNINEKELEIRYETDEAKKARLSTDLKNLIAERDVFFGG